MDIAVKVVGYILCLIFMAGLVTLIVMMCINEFRRFFDRRKKNKNKNDDKGED